MRLWYIASLAIPAAVQGTDPKPPTLIMGQGWVSFKVFDEYEDGDSMLLRVYYPESSQPTGDSLDQQLKDDMTNRMTHGPNEEIPSESSQIIGQALWLDDKRLECLYRNGFKYGILELNGNGFGWLGSVSEDLPRTRQACYMVHLLRQRVLGQLFPNPVIDYDDAYIESHPNVHKIAYFSSDKRRGVIVPLVLQYSDTITHLFVRFLEGDMCLWSSGEYGIEDYSWAAQARMAKVLSDEKCPSASAVKQAIEDPNKPKKKNFLQSMYASIFPDKPVTDSAMSG